jgi:hypothetical protein
MVADHDASGSCDLLEFKMLVGFLVYFNSSRHELDELYEFFPRGLDLDGFYTASHLMGEPLDDTDAAEHFERLCLKHDAAAVSPCIALEHFLFWMARRQGVEDGVDAHIDMAIEQVGGAGSNGYCP